MIDESLKSAGRKAISNGSADKFAEVLGQAIKKHGNIGAIQLLLSSKVLEYSSRNFREQLRVVRRALRIIGNGEHYELRSALSACAALHKKRKAIEAALGQTDFTSVSPASAIMALLYWAQNQSYLFRKEYATDAASSLGAGAEYVDVTSIAMNASRRASVTGQGVSIAGAAEAQFEICSLVISYLRYTNKNILIDNDSLYSLNPYGNPDFEHVVSLASVWSYLAIIWGDLSTGLVSVEGVLPAVKLNDSEELLLKTRGPSLVRWQALVSASLGPRITALRDQLSDNPDSLKPIADWLQSLPGASVVRLDMFPLDALRRALVSCRRSIENEYLYQATYYGAIINDLAVRSSGPRSVLWVDAVRVLLACQVLADAALLREDLNDPPEGPAASRAVIRILETDFIRLIIAATGMQRSAVQDAVAFWIFDHTCKHRCLATQPLLKIGAEIWMTPTLVSSVDPIAVLDELRNQFSEKYVSRASRSFENGLDQICEGSSGVIKCETKKIALGKEILEFDGLYFWSGSIIIAEAKWLRATYGSEFEQASRLQMEKAIDQLRVRKRAIEENRNDLCSIWSSVDPDIIKRANILTVAVMSNLRYSGHITMDNIFITDHFIWKRFFSSERSAIKWVVGDGVLKSEKVPMLEKFDFNVEGFQEYLRSPPQLDNIYSHITKEEACLPSVRGERCIFFPHYKWTHHSGPPV